ncbi:hypothetical protein SAMN06265348_102180 [Pedobacter westerhofensis]|uniref:Uncharacterized protein n=1 Tax=Pedobacter westerhofensis TaxID=425512 RepID=A0A521BC17_9SPHI|nr:hypothetical protein [Pedobacter westerhofensis]SMO44606.1 hypothetical protein SAMN06265348_102180 [Pedobacter westerhofensis]
MKGFFIVLIAALIYFPKTVSAQIKGDSVLYDINKKVSKILSQNDVPRLIKDSIAIYTYTITIKIRNSKNGSTNAELSVSDAMLYTYFPNLKQLSKIDFKPLVLNTLGTTLVIPIVIANKSTTATNRYTRQEGKLLIDMGLVWEDLNRMLTSLVSKESDRREIRLILKPIMIDIFNISKN